MFPAASDRRQLTTDALRLLRLWRRSWIVLTPMVAVMMAVRTRRRLWLTTEPIKLLLVSVVDRGLRCLGRRGGVVSGSVLDGTPALMISPSVRSLCLTAGAMSVKRRNGDLAMSVVSAWGTRRPCHICGVSMGDDLLIALCLNRQVMAVSLEAQVADRGRCDDGHVSNLAVAEMSTAEAPKLECRASFCPA